MMNKTLLFLSRLVIINFLIFVGLLIFLDKREALNLVPIQPDSTANQNIAQATNSPKMQITSAIPSAAPIINPTPTIQNLFAQLQNHNTQNDCWIIYRQHIYNITSYFGSHPGGDAALLKYCGKDATAGFDTKDKSVPQEHSAAAQSMLQQFLVQ